MTAAKKRPKLVAMQISARLQERIDKFRAKLAKASPGINVTASDAMRALIERGLDHDSM